MVNVLGNGHEVGINWCCCIRFKERLATVMAYPVLTSISKDRHLSNEPLREVHSFLPQEDRYLEILILHKGRSQWPRGLRRRSAAARLLRLWVRISPGAWMFVCCECCVLSGRCLWDELITRPEEFYRMWLRRCVWSRNLMNEEALAHWGLLSQIKKTS